MKEEIGARMGENACRAHVIPQERTSVQCPDQDVQPAVSANTKRYIDSTLGRGTNGKIWICKGILHRGVCVPACLVLCVRCVGAQLSREPCASACGEWTCCGAEATRDMLCSAGVGKVEHASENPCTHVCE